MESTFLQLKCWKDNKIISSWKRRFDLNNYKHCNRYFWTKINLEMLKWASWILYDLTWIRHVNERGTLRQDAVEHIHICIEQSIKSFSYRERKYAIVIRGFKCKVMNAGKTYVCTSTACACINIFKTIISNCFASGRVILHII